MKIRNLFAGYLCLLILSATTHAQSKIYTDAEREQLAQAVTKKYVAELVPQGREAYDAKNYREAVGRMTQVLIVDPHNYDGLMIRGSALKNLNFWAEAERDFRQGVADFPDDWWANLEIGALLTDEGKPAEAIPYLKKAVAKKPAAENYWYDRYWLGVASLYAGDYQVCVENFDIFFPKAEKVWDGDYLERAECHLRLGNVEQAKADYAKAQALKPTGDWVKLYAELTSKPAQACKSDSVKMLKDAQEKQSDGKIAEAYRILWYATTCHPSSYVMLEMQAEIETGYQMTIAGRTHALKAWQMSADTSEFNKKHRADFINKYYAKTFPPRDVNNGYKMDSSFVGRARFPLVNFSYYFYNDIQSSLKSAEEGLLIYEEPKEYLIERLNTLNNALALEPNNVAALELRARAYLNLGNSNEFINHAWLDTTRALKLNPNSAIAHLVRGQVFAAESNYSAAIAEYDQALKIAPNEDRASINRGLAKYLTKDTAGAFADLSRAIELNPKVRRYYWRRGQQYEAENRLEEAVSDYRNAARFLADEAEIDLIHLLYLTGKKQEADERHAKVYWFWEKVIKENSYPYYSKIAEYQPDVLARAGVIKAESEQRSKADAQQTQPTLTPEIRSAYENMMQRYNAAIAEYNESVKRTERDSTNPNVQLVEGIKRSNRLAKAKKILDDFISYYGSRLPPDMLNRVKNMRTEIMKPR